jgi:hypothetical protein
MHCLIRSLPTGLRTGDETTKKTLKWLVLEQVYSVKPRPVPTSPLLTICRTIFYTTRFAHCTNSDWQTSFQLLEHVLYSIFVVNWLAEDEEDTPKTSKIGAVRELVEEDEGNVRSPTSKRFNSLGLCVRRSGGKKSDEKKRPRRKISITSSTDAEAPIVAAVATMGPLLLLPLRLATEEPKGDIIKEVELSTMPQAATEPSEPVLVPEFMDELNLILWSQKLLKQLYLPSFQSRMPILLTLLPLLNQLLRLSRIQQSLPTNHNLGKVVIEGDHHPREVNQSFLVSAGLCIQSLDIPMDPNRCGDWSSP